MEIKKGDKWSRFSYGEITDINGEDVQLKNEHGQQWWISKALLENEFSFASSIEETKRINQTELSSLVIGNPGVVMTVNFNKKVDEKDVAEIILEARPATLVGAKKLAKDILKGEERTIVGRHVNSIDEMGRLQFIDMELERDTSKEYDTRLRKVDPRTINWVIFKNVKYTK
jgi:hypothetical protein